MTEHDDRLTAIERRLAALEEARAVSAQQRATTPSTAPVPGETDTSGGSPAPEGTSSASGSIGYTGRVDLIGPVQWEIRYATESTLALPTDTLVEVFAALAHPARIRIVRLLLRGNKSVTQLQAADDFGTTGQLYHHLKTLTTASLVTKVGRNEYGVAPTHTVPLLVSMLAAADLGGSL